MIKSDSQVSSYLYVKNRKKSDSQSDIILSITPSNDLKYQIEVSWLNTTELTRPFVLIICRVLSKEWRRVFKRYPIYYCFVNYHETGSNTLYFNFTSKERLTEKDSLFLCDNVCRLFEECLNRVIARQTAEVADHEQQEVVPPQLELLSAELTKVDQTYQQLVTEIREQEVVLKQLASQPIAELNPEEMRQQRYLLQQMYQQVEQQRQQLDSLADLRSELSKEESKNNSESSTFFSADKDYPKQFNTSESVNQDIEQSEKVKSFDAFQLFDEVDRVLQPFGQLTGQKTKQADSLSQVAEISELRRELQAMQEEVTYYQKQAVKFEQKTNQLVTMVESLENNRDELRKQAQFDIEQAELDLANTESQLITELNEKKRLLVEMKGLQKTIQSLEENLKLIDSELLQEQDYADTMEHENNQLESLLDQFKEQNTLLTQKMQQQNELIATQRESIEMLKQRLLTLPIDNSHNELATDNQLFSRLQQLCEQIEEQPNVTQSTLDWILGNIHQLEHELENVLSDEQELGQQDAIDSDNSEATKELLEKSDEKSELPTSNGSKDWTANVVSHIDEVEQEQFEDLYDLDPYIDYVASEELVKSLSQDQKRIEQDIKLLFTSLDTQPEKMEKISKTQYHFHRKNCNQLISRWNRVKKIRNIDKNTKFLEFCLYYLDYFNEFNLLLESSIKEPFFDKRHILIDAATFAELKAYSLLSTYLDKYYLQVSEYVEQYFLEDEEID
ncbi:hypothetical protein CBF34_03330 [Vagococcus penaei]|uniref:Uncharacterized protein n=1 Tax=Vagococcus penaei TaxID=633807 RepID=A0A1Q2D7L4_9ENTE|nr:hypothetical protein [Vagococcus penaei]AQP54311.1 hypothetical protein BW732_08805 [Vagococcus penaei]RSU05802.1 hypothetical protein CBF34_03330 [Vagococcus penaei]